MDFIEIHRIFGKMRFLCYLPTTTIFPPYFDPTSALPFVPVLRQPMRRRRLPRLPSIEARIQAWGATVGDAEMAAVAPKPWGTTQWRRLITKERSRINARARANRMVLRSLQFLDRQGYLAARADVPGFDILAVGSEGAELIYVTLFVLDETGGWPPKPILKLLREFPRPARCRTVVHRWRLEARKPDVREV
jgi:hypothetical protein